VEGGGAHHGQEREKWSMNEKKNFANEKKKTLRVSRRGGSGSAQGIISPWCCDTSYRYVTSPHTGRENLKLLFAVDGQTVFIKIEYI
jgi:hypothetical protein